VALQFDPEVLARLLVGEQRADHDELEMSERWKYPW
jgi:hypothetical protein